MKAAYTRAALTRPRHTPMLRSTTATPLLLLLLPLLLAWTAVWAADPWLLQFPADCPWVEPSGCGQLASPAICCNASSRCSGLPISYHCPITCGLCPDHGPQPCGDIQCQNSGILDYKNCTCRCKGHMGGSLCGECGEDEEWCHNFKPREMCGKTMGINPYLCPHYCGLCPDTCGGKQCGNHGKLNTTSCQCECMGLFSGPNCETCPPDDHHVCLHLEEESCTTEPLMFSLMQTNCPYKCGLCPKLTTNE